jgi:hypothetical protein
MTPDSIYAELNEYSKTPTATKFGSTYLANLLTCPLKARASEELGPPAPVLFGDTTRPKVTGWRAGVAFHGMRNLKWEGSAAARFAALDSVSKNERDIDVHAALQAFKRESEALDERRLGDEEAAELFLQHPSSIWTGRPDSVRRIDERHANAFASLGLAGLEAGTYLWDYKLNSAVSVSDAESYKLDLQGPYYMWLYETVTGVTPRGMIYDLVSRAAKPTISRLLVLLSYTDEMRAWVESAVDTAEIVRSHGAYRANPSCCSGTYSPCKFAGVCTRRGTWESNQDLQNWVRQPSADVLPEGEEV